MRSKMLGLAIALSTFGLGVAATTLWIAHHTPAAQRLESRRDDLEGGSFLEEVKTPEDSRCGGNIPYIVDDEQESDTTLPVDTLKHRELSKPVPIYPAAARDAHISGTVIVRVVVNACGDVVKARAISGHILLQKAAVDAATKARFKPEYLYGQYTDVGGTLRYDFLLQ